MKKPKQTPPATKQTKEQKPQIKKNPTSQKPPQANEQKTHQKNPNPKSPPSHPLQKKFESQQLLNFADR